MMAEAARDAIQLARGLDNVFGTTARQCSAEGHDCSNDHDFLGDYRGHFVSTAARPSGSRGCVVATDGDESSERGSSRPIDLGGSLTFPECACSFSDLIVIGWLEPASIVQV